MFAWTLAYREQDVGCAVMKSEAEMCEEQCTILTSLNSPLFISLRSHSVWFRPSGLYIAQC